MIKKKLVLSVAFMLSACSSVPDVSKKMPERKICDGSEKTITDLICKKK
mgnify:CR=1 FL=1